MNWIRIASAQDLQDDEVMAVTVGSARIALYRSAGEFFATDNRCTHAEASMSEGYLEDGCIECPLHQARFDIRTGKALCAPATVDLRTHAVRREGDEIYVVDPAAP
ncbi:bifunctional 3-phenylpropionate/cinnamic acid dioxygenase ferredoxin subunit [Pseudorhodoferax soli]|uniref:3-phenylpropionate/trans-cinnamate dioxygenase ferredoxin subunit n=1 Tax=Pseudorhodoferax soli TaxID=545864 RepID=A0A368Y3X2_9BURK|nr:bifunctional 3-phenylpropionate/cinnamic acid dioxygenase ferredoxin subunit [Pseudorhodoferax soli]RCW74056.1 3-phenylpropionate/trans-cinnamate dioxygenase ferredoxin subunit [Pseudorhodoferax soli]